MDQHVDYSHSNRAVSLIQSCISIRYFTDKSTSVWHSADLKVINYINIQLTQLTVCFLLPFLLRLILLHSFEKNAHNLAKVFMSSLDELTSGYLSCCDGWTVINKLNKKAPRVKLVNLCHVAELNSASSCVWTGWCLVYCKDPEDILGVWRLLSVFIYI